MFKEASELVDAIDVRGESDSLKATYYALTARYYFDMADFNNDPFHTPGYYRRGDANLD